MKPTKSVENVGFLLAGLILGLVVVLFVGWIVAPDVNPFGPGSAGELSMEGSIGALDPITLTWSGGDEPPPTSANFSIDNEIRVELEQDQSQLVLRPTRPLAAGEHVLRYQPFEGQTAEWSFTVRPPEPLYLQEAAGQRRLYRWRAGDPLLLSADHLVTDYSPTLQGSLIAYAASNDQGGNDLWRVDREAEQRMLLMSCGADRCGQLAWSADGGRLAFSRSAAGSPQQTRIWTIDADGEQAAPLFQDMSRLGSDPLWSPDGRRLVFYDPAVNGVRILDLDTVREEVIPSRSGVSGAWSGDGEQLFLPLLVFLGEEPVTHLYQLDIEERDLSLLLGEEDGWRQIGEPALGLSGDWMAVAGQRRSSGAGLELWLVDVAAGQARSLAQDQRFSYGGPSWDALGQQLLFQRFPLDQNGAAPDLMLWSAEANSIQLLLENASSADWLN